MAAWVTAVLAMAIPVTAETVAVPVTAAKAVVQVVVVRVAAVQVVAAVRVIPEEINPAAVAKVVP